MASSGVKRSVSAVNPRRSDIITVTLRSSPPSLSASGELSRLATTSSET